MSAPVSHSLPLPLRVQSSCDVACFFYAGAYRTDDDKPLVLNVVRKAEAIVAADKSLNHEYLDIAGDAKFVNLSRAVLFGKDSPAIKENRIVSAQSLSGTGALRVGSEFIARFLPKVRSEAAACSLGAFKCLLG